MTISETDPKIIRGRITGLRSEERFRECFITGANVGNGNGACCSATSLSMADSKASASSVRPTDSSQRGDSGNFFRKYQTTSAPSPPSMNIARQPNVGIMSLPSSAATGNPVTTKTVMKPSHLPRDCGGTNSVSVEYPTTFSAPSPNPMMHWIKIKTCMEGAKAATMDANPKMARFD